jgi:hypothetical protein
MMMAKQAETWNKICSFLSFKLYISMAETKLNEVTEAI